MRFPDKVQTSVEFLDGDELFDGPLVGASCEVHEWLNQPAPGNYLGWETFSIKACYLSNAFKAAYSAFGSRYATPLDIRTIHVAVDFVNHVIFFTFDPLEDFDVVVVRLQEEWEEGIDEVRKARKQEKADIIREFEEAEEANN